MSHTNTTQNYKYPQFVGTDKPTFLGDFNGFFSKLDSDLSEIAINMSDLVTAVEDLENVTSNNANAVSSMQAQQNINTNNINNLSASVNTAVTTNADIIAKMGTASLTTQESSLIEAVNNMNSKLNTVQTMVGELKDIRDNIGRKQFISNSKSIQNGQFIELEKPITNIPAGKYLLRVVATSQTNANGYREIQCRVSASSTTTPHDVERLYGGQTKAKSGGATLVTSFDYIEMDSEFSIWPFFKQDSGSTLNVSYNIQLVRIG